MTQFVRSEKMIFNSSKFRQKIFLPKQLAPFGCRTASKSTQKSLSVTMVIQNHTHKHRRRHRTPLPLRPLLLLLSPPLIQSINVLVGDETTASELSAALPTHNTTFYIAPSTPPPYPHIPAIDVVIGTGSHNFTTVLSTVPQLSATRYYQYMYTGVDALLPAIPARYTVCNVHQAAISIAEFVMGGMLGFTTRLIAANTAMKRCAWNRRSVGICSIHLYIYAIGFLKLCIHTCARSTHCTAHRLPKDGRTFEIPQGVYVYTQIYIMYIVQIISRH